MRVPSVSRLAHVAFGLATTAIAAQHGDSNEFIARSARNTVVKKQRIGLLEPRQLLDPYEHCVQDTAVFSSEDSGDTAVANLEEQRQCVLCFSCFNEVCNEPNPSDTCVNLGCPPYISCMIHGVPAPTPSPSRAPTPAPTAEPTSQPTMEPTREPTTEPTREPTRSPTLEPTPEPTKKRQRRCRFCQRNGCFVPENENSRQCQSCGSIKDCPDIGALTVREVDDEGEGEDEDDRNPSTTTSPTPVPTNPKTSSPTPTKNPTLSPTLTPTKPPTSSPSSRPTPSPSREPTRSPTTKPSASPTNPLTASPTPFPTPPPIVAPSPFPTPLPTVSTNKPTPIPSPSPTRFPTTSPTPSDAERPSIGAQGQDPNTNHTTGETCTKNRQCLSDTCRNGACMATPDCYPIKHKFGTPFDKNKVNLVFVGSAFNSSTHEEWRAQVNRTYDAFSNYKALSKSTKQLNVFVVDPSDLNPSFCFFDCAGIDRLLCCDVTIAQELSSKCFSDGANLQTIVIHNDEKYGGAGYTFQNIATTSIHPKGPEIAVHELGHSLFELADEYAYGTGTNQSANCGSTSTCEKWSDLIGNTPQGYNNVSCIPGCRLGEFFVGESSYMDILSNPVGAVNTRFSCCTYQALTKTMPTYCDAFNFENSSVFNYCQKNDYQGYGQANYDSDPAEIPAELTPSSTRYVHVSQPLLVRIGLQYGQNSSTVVLGDSDPRPGGLYRRSDVLGDYRSVKHARKIGVDTPVVRVRVIYLTGKEILYFSTKTIIDVIPPDIDGSTPADDEPRQVEGLADILDLVLDTRGRTVRKIRVKLMQTKT